MLRQTLIAAHKVTKAQHCWAFLVVERVKSDL